ncbi:hypothetical protein [Fibrella aquatilis]|uniref:Uncharacterized protein n=1 Tax=Fibrella aquatilis TaxID=2817059 RepID=A0A939K058_9BACT|nr:hypothetical protein [Fibrella aquatilis]MBO0931646.1 hypothetical protein [Fibrella aquatilis]
MKTPLLIICFAISYCCAFSQEATKEGTPLTKRFGFSAGYYGDKVTNHGLLFGVERYLATTEHYTVISSVQLAAFVADQNFTALSVLPRIGLRKTANSGLLAEGSIGLGYLHKFYAYTEYEVGGQGQLIAKRKAAQASVMPSICLGIGYDFRRKTKLPFLYFLRGSVNYNYPSKQLFFEASYAIETGLTYVPTIKIGKR